MKNQDMKVFSLTIDPVLLLGTAGFLREYSTDHELVGEVQRQTLLQVFAAGDDIANLIGDSKTTMDLVGKHSMAFVIPNSYIGHIAQIMSDALDTMPDKKKGALKILVDAWRPAFQHVLDLDDGQQSTDFGGRFESMN